MYDDEKASHGTQNPNLGSLAHATVGTCNAVDQSSSVAPTLEAEVQASAGRRHRWRREKLLVLVSSYMYLLSKTETKSSELLVSSFTPMSPHLS